MPKRRTPFPRRYTTVHMNRDGVRVPFVRLSGRWLEAFGFKEGAKFTAIGVEGGLLVLAVYEPASAAPSSHRGTPSGRAAAVIRSRRASRHNRRSPSFPRPSPRHATAPLSTPTRRSCLHFALGSKCLHGPFFSWNIRADP